MFLAARPRGNADIGAWREGFELMCATFELPSDAKTDPVKLLGVPGLTVRAPNASPDTVLLHLHGGGYVMGSSGSYREFAYRLSAATGSAIVVIDYRLAPEHKFPAPVEDAVSAYKAMLGEYDPCRIVLSGDSVGGGLVVATLVALRDEGIPLPAGGVSISGNMDLASEIESFETNKNSDPLITRRMNVETGKLYLGGLDPKTPLASPLYASVHDLPPLLLLVGESEVLRDGSVILARNVVNAGGSAQVILEPNVFHIWPLFPFLPESSRSLNQISKFARRQFGVGR
jgi:acetyl esterase/lipase